VRVFLRELLVSCLFPRAKSISLDLSSTQCGQLVNPGVPHREFPFTLTTMWRLAKSTQGYSGNGETITADQNESSVEKSGIEPPTSWLQARRSWSPQVV